MTRVVVFGSDGIARQQATSQPVAHPMSGCLHTGPGINRGVLRPGCARPGRRPPGARADPSATRSAPPPALPRPAPPRRRLRRAPPSADRSVEVPHRSTRPPGRAEIIQRRIRGRDPVAAFFGGTSPYSPRPSPTHACRAVPRAPAPASAGTPSAPAARNGSFRPETEGPRAVAVVLVAVYHIWFGRVSGGVDVFLPLAGFLITGSLVRSPERGGRVRFAAFWTRLARRGPPPPIRPGPTSTPAPACGNRPWAASGHCSSTGSTCPTTSSSCTSPTTCVPGAPVRPSSATCSCPGMKTT